MEVRGACGWLVLQTLQPRLPGLRARRWLSTARPVTAPATLSRLPPLPMRGPRLRPIRRRCFCPCHRYFRRPEGDDLLRTWPTRQKGNDFLRQRGSPKPVPEPQAGTPKVASGWVERPFGVGFGRNERQQTAGNAPSQNRATCLCRHLPARRAQAGGRPASRRSAVKLSWFLCLFTAIYSRAFALLAVYMRKRTRLTDSGASDCLGTPCRLAL
jgi:hypothetical protein